MMTKTKVQTIKQCIGVDSYNLCLTGDIGRTLATPSGGLNEHIPVVLVIKDDEDSNGSEVR